VPQWLSGTNALFNAS